MLIIGFCYIFSVSLMFAALYSREKTLLPEREEELALELHVYVCFIHFICIHSFLTVNLLWCLMLLLFGVFEMCFCLSGICRHPSDPSAGQRTGMSPGQRRRSLVLRSILSPCWTVASSCVK